MEQTALTEIYKDMGIDADVVRFVKEAEDSLQVELQRVDETAEYCQMKVLLAMQKNGLSDIHFAETTGYGYDDIGRDVMEKVYAAIFHTEAALVRPAILSGTHALAIALFGNLRTGDELLSPVGKPYDTLDEVIGITPSYGSLMDYGITYRQVDLLPGTGEADDDSIFDYEGIRAAINEHTKLVTIQRSKGYDVRPTLSVAQIGKLIAFIKGIKPDVICMVDNCYGEFVERMEPTDVGADLVVGSLIKNPGGGIAPTGAYLAGRKDVIEHAATRMTAPGIGAEVGASLGLNRLLFEGLFLAPTTVASAIKGAILLARVYERLGFAVLPPASEIRRDIIQTVTLGSAEGVVAFCTGIQAAAPVDSFVAPEPWDMPGYGDPVIMAAGAFIQGASIELSADAPIREPYAVYFQGGLTYPHAKVGVLMSVQKMKEKGLLRNLSDFPSEF